MLSQIIFNPGAFIDVIKCACTDTFQAAYPQCADWCVPYPMSAPTALKCSLDNSFIKTNQSQVLNYDTQNLPGIISGMRKVCALQSTLLGNVSESDGEVTPAPTSPAPAPTSGAANNKVVWGSVVALVLLGLSVGGL